MKKPFILTCALMLALSVSLAACFEDESAETEEKPSSSVEQTEKDDDDDDEVQEASAGEDKDLDMTPSEALDNMKRDAGVVGDKATELFNKAKDAATQAIGE